MTDLERMAVLKAELIAFHLRCSERGLLTKKEAERFVDADTEWHEIRDRLSPEPPISFSHGEV